MAGGRVGNGRGLGRFEEYFASTLAPGDTFAVAGLSLEVEAIRDTDLIVRATTRPARLPSYMGARMAISTRLADRVRGFLADPASWAPYPQDVRVWLEMKARRSVQSDDHTSALQSIMRISYDVFCLQKKNQHNQS